VPRGDAREAGDQHAKQRGEAAAFTPVAMNAVTGVGAAVIHIRAHAWNGTAAT